MPKRRKTFEAMAPTTGDLFSMAIVVVLFLIGAGAIILAAAVRA